MSGLVRALVLTGAALPLPFFLAAQTPAPRVALAASTQAAINKYCAGCHNSRAKTGGLSLEGRPLDVSADPETWEKVAKKLQLGVMPPVECRAPMPQRTRRWCVT